MYVTQLVNVKNVNVLIANATLIVSANAFANFDTFKSVLGQIFNLFIHKLN